VLGVNLKAIYFVFFFISVAAFATEKNDDPCNAQGGGVTAGYMCVAQKNKLADEQLNAEYKKASKEPKKKKLHCAKTGHTPNWLAYFVLLKGHGLNSERPSVSS
jgi:uncharacterized protein YecT (DUF1311 family)